MFIVNVAKFHGFQRLLQPSMMTLTYYDRAQQEQFFRVITHPKMAHLISHL